MANVAMADAGILAWDEKDRHDLRRPAVGIREHDPSVGPAGGAGDDLDDDTHPTWLPLGAPSTNAPGRKNGTPPFPAHPSGHAAFGAAAFPAACTSACTGCSTPSPSTHRVIPTPPGTSAACRSESPSRRTSSAPA